MQEVSGSIPLTSTNETTSGVAQHLQYALSTVRFSLVPFV
jgi:hypothetical protein